MKTQGYNGNRYDSKHEELNEWLHLVDTYIKGYVNTWSKPTVNTIEKYLNESLEWMRDNLEIYSPKQQEMMLKKEKHITNLINAKRIAMYGNTKSSNSLRIKETPLPPTPPNEVDEFEGYINVLKQVEKISLDKYYNDFLCLVDNSGVNEITKNHYKARMNEVYEMRIGLPL